MSFVLDYLSEVATIALHVDETSIEACATLLAKHRALHGRLFILGIGGSAANASHAVNDFRKLAHIEAYAPSDNVAELTARTNDDGWPTVFVEWLKISRLTDRDVVLVLSVHGGQSEVSANLVSALVYAKEIGSTILGIVGDTKGYTYQVANACIVIPMINLEHMTPHAESFQSVLCHLLVWHPTLAL